MRSLPAGIDQRSPARHPDWLGPDDLSLKIQEIREATNYEIPIQLKLPRVRRACTTTVRDGRQVQPRHRSTWTAPRAAPAPDRTSPRRRPGIPLLAAIPEARRALEGRRAWPTRSTSSSLAWDSQRRRRRQGPGAGRRPRSRSGHSALMALNCNKARSPASPTTRAPSASRPASATTATSGRCPVGITTQDPGASQASRRRGSPRPASYNFLHDADARMPDARPRLRRDRCPQPQEPEGTCAQG